MLRPVLASAVLLGLGASAQAQEAAHEVPDYGPNLERFEYPFPVETFAFESQGQEVSMAYMDVAPEAAGANGQTVVALHGKNFCGATWEGTIRPLVAAGYRVIAPDQIGFCKSTKPEDYQFTFHQLAANTRALLAELGLERTIVMGHSMGGMLAMRYALAYPQATGGLVLVNPIGLEDWAAQGVPYRTVDQWYASELETSFEKIKSYQQSTYYGGEWRPEYDRWVDMLAGMYVGEGKERVAWNQALTYDMVFTQPVVHQLERIQAPTLVMIGERDTTAIGKDAAPPEVAERLGHYAVLGGHASQRIPSALLVPFPQLGHSPQIQAPEVFNEALLANLPDLR